MVLDKLFSFLGVKSNEIELFQKKIKELYEKNEQFLEEVLELRALVKQLQEDKDLLESQVIEMNKNINEEKDKWQE